MGVDSIDIGAWVWWLLAATLVAQACVIVAFIYLYWRDRNELAAFEPTCPPRCNIKADPDGPTAGQPRCATCGKWRTKPCE